MQSPLLILPGDHEVITTRPAGRAGWAAQCNGLASLKDSGPIDAPASKHFVSDSAVGQERLTFAERQFIGATEMEHVSNVES